MTSCGYGNNQKTQSQSVEYVKVRFFAHLLKHVRTACGFSFQIKVYIQKDLASNDGENVQNITQST